MTEVNLATLFGVALFGGAGAYLGTYLREKGKNLATREDIDRVVRKTEEIKAEVGAEAWLREKRWAIKWECYSEIVESLGELHTLISESIALERPSFGVDVAAAQSAAAERRSQAYAAFARFRRFGSKAQLAVSPEVRTALTAFGDKWMEVQGSLAEQGTVCREAWLEIKEIMRNDLFPENPA